MTAVVLLSCGRHPVSGQPAPVPVEAQAVRLARRLGAGVVGVHAGPALGSAADHLGMGLDEIVHIEISADADPLPSLVEKLRRTAPDLVLTGRRGQGGDDTGLAPYLLAEALGLPIVADAVAAVRTGRRLAVEQAPGRGARRRIEVDLPAVVTVHPAAPRPLAFALAARRRGVVRREPGLVTPHDGTEVEQRPYRARPKVMSAAPAADRAGALLIDPAPEAAAQAILEHLRRIGVLAPSPIR